MRQARCGLRRAGRGLTLLELMVGVAVLAVLASLALPGLGRQLARWKLQSVAEQLAGDLAEARWDAAQRGHTQHLLVQSGERWCWSVSEAPGCGCEQVQACQRRRVEAPRHGGVTIEATAHIAFEPTAEAHAAASSLALSNRSGDKLRIVLTALGRARICSPDGPRMGYGAC